MQKSIILILVLVALGGILCFYNLGGWDLWNADEPRHAQIAKEMLQGEGWIIPHLNGEVYPNKPPLFFWFIAVTAQAVGGMSEFAARFPSALCGVLTLLLLFFLGKRLFGEKTAFLAALILATNVAFLWLARKANTDATLTLFTTAAITFFYVGFYQQRGRWLFYLLAYCAMALGVLTKTQIGVVVPIVVVGGYFLLQREMRFFNDPSHIPGIALFVAFIGGWLSLTYLSGGGEYLQGLLSQQAVSTLFTTTSQSRPWYYYVVNFPAGFIPWIIFLPSALIYGFSTKDSKREFIFIFFWFVVTFAFFSLAQSKHEPSLLPLYPPAALMVGLLLKAFPLGAEGAKNRIVSIPLIVLIIVLALAAISLLIVAASKGNYYLEHPWEIGLVSAFIMGGGSFFSFFTHHQRSRELPFYVLVAMVCALTLYGAARIVPEINTYKSPRPFSQTIVSSMKPGDQLGIYQLEGANFMYYTGYNQMIWLEKEEELKAFLSSPKRVLCIMQERQYKQRAEDPSLSLFLIATGRVEQERLVVISNHQAP
jgi:4-amino-4-deoxy-L-arabinose transferase-like glycosyltransferase